MKKKRYSESKLYIASRIEADGYAPHLQFSSFSAFCARVCADWTIGRYDRRIILPQTCEYTLFLDWWRHLQIFCSKILRCSTQLNIGDSLNNHKQTDCRMGLCISVRSFTTLPTWNSTFHIQHFSYYNNMINHLLQSATPVIYRKVYESAISFLSMISWTSRNPRAIRLVRVQPETPQGERDPRCCKSLEAV